MMKEHHSKKFKVENKKTKLICNGYVFQEGESRTSTVRARSIGLIQLWRTHLDLEDSSGFGGLILSLEDSSGFGGLIHLQYR